MSEQIDIPDFQSEAEEAAWWDSHPEETLAMFEAAAKDGTLGRGTLERRAQDPIAVIQLSADDIALAKQLAERQGLLYQIYLQNLVHQRLLQERDAVLGR